MKIPPMGPGGCQHPPQMSLPQNLTQDLKQIPGLAEDLDKYHIQLPPPPPPPPGGPPPGGGPGGPGGARGCHRPPPPPPPQTDNDWEDYNDAQLNENISTALEFLQARLLE